MLALLTVPNNELMIAIRLSYHNLNKTIAKLQCKTHMLVARRWMRRAAAAESS